ncbi:hypothetical protein [Aeromicrobium sp. Sec7.5]|uniref:hypothetical protein n=1 Tax=Aeromicrobium sp. Sec7.5 TaxID=3121276 RepID=UPI002FE439DA
MNDAIHDWADDPVDPVDEERRAPAVVPTGHAEIDEALAALEQLPHRPVTEHVASYDAIHHVVRTTLADAGRPEGPGTL